TCCCNRILETYKIEISEEPPEDCVPSDDGLCEVWPAAENPEGFVDYWIKECPECPQEPAVLLAAITSQNSTIKIDNAIKDGEGFEKSLVFSNPRLYELIKCVEKKAGLPGDPGPGLEEELTVIEEILPPFGGEKDLLSEFLQTGITVKFSKGIRSETVDNDTFQVAVFAPIARSGFLIHHYEYIEGDIEGSRDNKSFTFIPKAKDAPEIFYPYKIELSPKLKILVQIKCDFIVDVDGKAVAGHHLLGKGQSGLNIDGKYNIQGGIFESWFTIIELNIPH
ncbi:MAG: hypothetical protein IMF19_13075, partial [Proteobacteria bacterium]|nr:hypothetical protein [Pseudomonadota bacterium]